MKASRIFTIMQVRQMRAGIKTTTITVEPETRKIHVLAVWPKEFSFLNEDFEETFKEPWMLKQFLKIRKDHGFFRFI